LQVLQLATDLPRPSVKTYRGHTTGGQIDSGQLGAIAALARQANASLFMVLLAIVKVLLHRYSGQEDILVGSPIAGRNHPDLESQVGFYVNMLPLRDRVLNDMAFLDLVAQVKATATEAYEHQAYPFDRLVDELDLKRDVSRSPMFDVIVVMQNAGAPAPALDGVSVTPFIRAYDVSKFDLAFSFEVRDGGLQVDISYNTDLFLPARARQIADHFPRW
jgi:non-ribosomal peptide synthetase component F